MTKRQLTGLIIVCIGILFCVCGLVLAAVCGQTRC